MSNLYVCAWLGPTTSEQAYGPFHSMEEVVALEKTLQAVGLDVSHHDLAELRTIVAECKEKRTDDARGWERLLRQVERAEANYGSAD